MRVCFLIGYWSNVYAHMKTLINVKIVNKVVGRILIK